DTYTLSLHDALPICHRCGRPVHDDGDVAVFREPNLVRLAIANGDERRAGRSAFLVAIDEHHRTVDVCPEHGAIVNRLIVGRIARSEEHTSELQSREK